MTSDIIIYHNPECGTSRNALAIMIRNAGIKPHVVEYLKTPPSRAMLEGLIARAGITPRKLHSSRKMASRLWTQQANASAERTTG